MTPTSPSADTAESRATQAHPALRLWDGMVDSVVASLSSRGVDPSRVVLLVPYAQLMEAGRRAWARRFPNGFAPRFESTRNWAATLQPFLPGTTDLSMDPARDSLIAASLLERVAPARLDAALRREMVTRLVDAARQLAPLAAAVPPDQRLDWVETQRPVLNPGLSALQWEGLVASLALTWVGTSSYATDVLWSPLAAPGMVADRLVVLQGFQQDPLASALAAHWGDAAEVFPLPAAVVAGTADHRLHPCSDAEDEAQRAAACVLAHLNAGRSPVALVATDRLLVRRISAWLQGAGVPLRDETGWKLSTTQAAACLVGLLRAADPRASTDDVLDWLKASPAWPDAAVLTLEARARQAGISRWRGVVSALADALPVGAVQVLDSLQAPRPLPLWLTSLADALKACGQWEVLRADAAGEQLLDALRLDDGAAAELAALGRMGDEGERREARLSLAAFTAWARDVLEGTTFMARSAADAPVVVLPLAQMLGRAFAATVVPGCDEVHLSPSPEPPGDWTAAQREALGLPGRERLAEAALAAWQSLLCVPALDILWRRTARGEAVAPSPWVQALGGEAAADPRALRSLTPQPEPEPAPTAPDLLPEALSASAYQDLRTCPYRFFALRQLRLSESAELDVEPDQRDLGNWLHDVLRAFHEERRDARPGADADRQALDRLAQTQAQARGLASDEGGAGFLPYQALWPALRDGYLAWLHRFEAAEGAMGPRFAQAEVTLHAQAGRWTLRGQLDRVDRQDSPEGPIPIVIDYKTESRSRTQDRLKDPLEDTQLAFYAALLPDETLRAGYLSITDQRGSSERDAPTVLFEHADVLAAREALLDGLEHDLDRIAAGAALPALGEGQACDFCAARGLCRKDFRA